MKNFDQEPPDYRIKEISGRPDIQADVIYLFIQNEIYKVLVISKVGKQILEGQEKLNTFI